jgi:predicted ArsR family transcriptional regulator
VDVPDRALSGLDQLGVGRAVATDRDDRPELVHQIERIALLRDPVRRALYEHVAEAAAPVSRDAAASAVGTSRSLAAFHLDKLVDEGVLTTTYRRLTGRTGPGAGRPAKLYARSDREISISLPPRDYELAARLLLGALASGGSEQLDRLRHVARQFGVKAGTAARAEGGRPSSRRALVRRLLGLLMRCGYEPVEEPTALHLRNGPFDALAQQETEVVCGMNLSLLEGVLDGMQATDLEARLEPTPGRCCVTLRPQS